MKKILSILASLSLLVTPAITVIACGEINTNEPTAIATELNSVITKTDLGTFKTQPTDDQILYQTKVINNNLDTTQIQLKTNANGQAIIAVNANSTVYSQGSVTITYKVNSNVILTNLFSIVIITDLGQFIDPPTDSQVLERVKELNNNLDTTQVQITGNDDNGNATITAVPNSPIYAPKISIDLTYVILDTLEEVITVTDLGQFATQPTNEEILNRAKDRNPNLDISQLEVVENTDGQATIIVIPGSIVYEPSWINLTYVVLPSLDIAITTTDLGVFATQPTNEEILERLKFSNANLFISQIQVIANADGKAKVAVIIGSTVYSQSERDLTYVIHTDLPLLKSVITITDLGEFEEDLYDGKILEQVGKLNQSLDIKEVYITAYADGKATITVREGSKVYAPGWLTLTYRIHTIVDLKTVITITELGQFATQPTDKEILDKVKSLNQSLDISQVYVLANINNQATIGVNIDSTIYRQGIVSFTYTVNSTHLPSISDVIKIRGLNTISSSNPDIILTQVKTLNPDLNLLEVEAVNIDSGHATIRVKDGSKVYAPGSIVVTFIINALPSITRDLTNIHLLLIGSASGDPDLQKILERVAKLNPKLVMSEVHLREETLTTSNIVISANVGSKVYSSSSSATLTFAFSKLVDFVVTNTDLGEFNGTPTIDEIFTRLYDKNKELNIRRDQLQVVVNADGKATVSVIPNSYYYYPGSVELTYSFIQLRNVAEDITIFDLGIFHTEPTEEEVITRIKKVNPNLILEEITIKFFPLVWNVILTAKNNSTIYLPRYQFRLTYRVVPWVNIEDQLSIRDLGTFNKVPTTQEILDRIKELNSTVDISQLQITANADRKATVAVIPNSEIYNFGSINVSYIVLRSPWLDISTRNIGVFHTKPTDNEIFNRLKELNPNLNYDEIDFENSPILSIVRLSVHDTSLVYYHQTEIIFFYVVILLRDLKDDLTITDLGTFELTATNDQILEKIKELNSNINLDEITLINVSNTQATVLVKNDSNVYNQGSIDITFTIHTLIPLKNIITVTELGTFDYALTVTNLIAKIASLNPSLITTEISLLSSSLTQATIMVNANSQIYEQGSVIVTFKIAIPIEKVVLNTNLGWFENPPTEEVIIRTTLKLNISLSISDVSVTKIENMSAVITVNANSQLYAQGSIRVTFSNPIELKTVLTVTDVGGILFATTSAILTQLKEENPNINTDELTVTNIHSILLVGSATINVKAGSKVYYPASIDVTFALIHL